MILILIVNFIAWLVYLFFAVTKSIKAQIAGDNWAVIDNNSSMIFVNLSMTLLTVLTTMSILLAHFLDQTTFLF